MCYTNTWRWSNVVQGINVPGDGNHVGNGLDVGGGADIDLARMGGLVAGSPGAAERDGVSGTGEDNDGRGNLEDESHFWRQGGWCGW